MEETKQKAIIEIRNLCRKADQIRSIYSSSVGCLVLINKIITLYVVIGSAICSMLLFASIPTQYQIFIGIFSASIFIASLIPGALDFSLKILEKTIAIKSWGKWIRDARSFCDIEEQQNDNNSFFLKQKELLESYKKIMEETPLIPDAQFLKYKRKHLQKVAISKYLDEHPFEKIKKIKRDIKINNN